MLLFRVLFFMLILFFPHVSNCYLHKDKECWDIRHGFLHSWTFLSNFSVSLPRPKKKKKSLPSNFENVLFSIQSTFLCLVISSPCDFEYHLLADNSQIYIASPDLFLNSRFRYLTAYLTSSWGWLESTSNSTRPRWNCCSSPRILPHHGLCISWW